MSLPLIKKYNKGISQYHVLIVREVEEDLRISKALGLNQVLGTRRVTVS